MRCGSDGAALFLVTEQPAFTAARHVLCDSVQLVLPPGTRQPCSAATGKEETSGYAWNEEIAVVIGT